MAERLRVVIAEDNYLVREGTRRFWTDVLWFNSVGYGVVYWRVLLAQLALGAVAFLVVGLLVGGNIALAHRLAPARPTAVTVAEQPVEQLRDLFLPYWRAVAVVAGLIAGAIAAAAAAQSWPTWLLWLHAQPFGKSDPHFGLDVGWFVFVLPFHLLLNSALFTALVFAAVAAAVAHYLFGGLRPQAPDRRITPQASVHLSMLLAAVVGLRAWRFYLAQFLLSYSTRGEITGLSYTDVNAQLPAYRFLLVISVVCVVLFLVNIRFRGWLLPVAAVGILLVASVILAGLVPAIVQRVQVEPEELQRERPYIAANIAATRSAFGLDNVQVDDFPADSELSPAEVADNAETLSTIRLWDPITALATYEPLQALRSYYEFTDVDVDRYQTSQGLLQVLIASRELAPDDLGSRSWLARRLLYTHGYGLVASGVSSGTADGRPVFLARDIPAEGDEVLVPDEQRLYFGDSGPAYSVVGTAQTELDFPTQGSEYETTTYTGADGVPVGSLARRLAFAVRFADPNLVLSSLIDGDSKIMLRRQVHDRVASVAPFLSLDHDPYPAVVEGRVLWIVDGYTLTDMVPYSKREDLGPLTAVQQRLLVPVANAEGGTDIVERVAALPGITGRANYIRNAVKAVVDAYDGTVRLYVIDGEDPLIRAWQSAFPEIFTPIAEASPELLEHFRYPEDMFRVQSAVYERYHIEGPDEFFSNEDAWRLPVDPSAGRNAESDEERRRLSGLRLRPTYQLLRLPGEEEAEFALLQPYTPRGENRTNLVAYLAGRSDPDKYGQLRAFVMPPNRTVFGPEQVVGRIDQQEEISEEITLLGQRQSSIIYGNVITLPVDDSLLYALPLFVRAEQSPIPVLAKVVLVFGDDIVMRDTLTDALEAMFGTVPGTVGPGDDEPTTGTADPRVRALIEQALRDFDQAEEALRNGDLGRYRELTESARGRLEQARILIRGSPSSPSAQAAGLPP